MNLKDKTQVNRIICGDAADVLKTISEGTIDAVITDPPYFLDKFDNEWDANRVLDKRNQHTVKSLPAGMKFDRAQGKNFYNWYYKISEQIFRVLKPGGFFFSFSSPRLYHRMASAVDDAGFEIRDCFIWLYTQNQVKAMSLDHFIDRMEIGEDDKASLKQKLEGWKTPQIKSCFEPIVMAQKPTSGTFLNNMINHRVGLFDTKVRIGNNMYPANVLAVDNINEIIDKFFLLPKPSKNEKGYDNVHQTVKPLTICEYLIRLSVFSPDAIVLDPFVGSGTTVVAAKNLGKRFLGIDINPEYVVVANKRLNDENQNLFSLTNVQSKKLSSSRL